MSLLDNIFADPLTDVFTLDQFLLVTFCGLFVGAMIGVFYAVFNKYSESFVSTVALLPAVVAVVILVVNDNIGMGIAVAGAFALIRFRSAPGKAKEIGAIFLSMGAGLLVGVGYLAFAIIFALISGLFYFLYTRISDHYGMQQIKDKVLNVTVPEDLDYSGIFDDIFANYTDGHRLKRVKTSNMGSMFRLTYSVTMKAGANEKAMIDEIRCRNGNLEVSVADIEGEEAGL